jgi:DNA-directed RNA polymerase subunit RPC12/RpoP
MKTICPNCSQHLEFESSAAGATIDCPSCAQPVTLPANLPPLIVTPVAQPQPQLVQAQKHLGPPHSCAYCGGALKKIREAKNTAGGCFIIIIGLLLTPLCIGLVILLYGLNEGSKCVFWWECLQCKQRFPRVRKWYEMG